MTDKRLVSDGGRTHDGLFEAIPSPVLSYSNANSDGGNEDSTASEYVVVAINPAFESTFETGGDELVGAGLDDIELTGTVERADGDSATTGPFETMTLGSILDRVEQADETAVRFQHESDGQTRHFRLQAFTADQPGTDGYLMFTDVTALEKHRRDLLTTVERLKRIARVANHDLRNPLEVATIRLEAAQDTGEAVHFEKVAGALDRIEQISSDVLGVGGGNVDPTDAVALEAVAEAAWDTVDTAEATLATETGLPAIRGDADRIQQLFENLFRNAVEHGRSDVRITVEPVSDGFAVADDGPGIPDAVEGRIFEAGFSTARGNSGLGLSIVEQIAREHGWNVSLTSTAADEGARFAFTGVERNTDQNAANR